MVTTEKILERLKGVSYPGFSRDIVSLGLVRDLKVEDGRVRFEIVLGPGQRAEAGEIERKARAALGHLAGVSNVEIGFPEIGAAGSSLRILGDPAPDPPQERRADAGLLPRVRHVVAVASGKGGVGKSTVAVNLAVALARRGASVGLLDADVYGPSIPLMVGMKNERPRIEPVERRLLPLERFGVRVMSLGFLVDPESAVIWRGPMVMKALEQLLGDVEWGELDILVLDLPPGTGDAQLTLAQRVRLAGSIIVTTPQDVALADAIKGVAMFRKVGVPVLGLVENMSYFQCPHCSERTDIFGHGGGREQANRLGVPFLGEVPLEAAIRQSGDQGEPVVSALESGAASTAFLELADAVRGALEERDSAGGTLDWTGVGPSGA